MNVKLLVPFFFVPFLLASALWASAAFALPDRNTPLPAEALPFKHEAESFFNSYKLSKPVYSIPASGKFNLTEFEKNSYFSGRQYWVYPVTGAIFYQGSKEESDEGSDEGSEEESGATTLDGFEQSQNGLILPAITAERMSLVLNQNARLSEVVGEISGSELEALSRSLTLRNLQDLFRNVAINRSSIEFASITLQERASHIVTNMRQYAYLSPLFNGVLSCDNDEAFRDVFLVRLLVIRLEEALSKEPVSSKEEYDRLNDVIRLVYHVLGRRIVNQYYAQVLEKISESEISDIDINWLLNCLRAMVVFESRHFNYSNVAETFSVNAEGSIDRILGEIAETVDRSPRNNQYPMFINGLEQKLYIPPLNGGEFNVGHGAESSSHYMTLLPSPGDDLDQEIDRQQQERPWPENFDTSSPYKDDYRRQLMALIAYWRFFRLYSASLHEMSDDHELAQLTRFMLRFVVSDENEPGQEGQMQWIRNNLISVLSLNSEILFSGSELKCSSQTLIYFLRNSVEEDAEPPSLVELGRALPE